MWPIHGNEPVINPKHPLCSGCHGSLRSEKKGCPVCGESVSGTARNTVVEAIVEKLPKVHCQWGCGKKTPSKAMLKRHEDEECSHRYSKKTLAEINLSTLIYGFFLLRSSPCL